MRTIMRNMVIRYLKELVQNGDFTDENIEHMAMCFVDEVQRTLQARRDFKEAT